MIVYGTVQQSAKNTWIFHVLNATELRAGLGFTWSARRPAR